MPTRPVVVVVEDQTELGDVIGDVLREEGYDVVAVPDQHAAMGEIRHREVDLVVADLPASGPGEGDPLAEISKEFPNLRLIVITDESHGEVPFFGPWRVSGCRVTLRRPFRLADLVAASREVVG